jgi:hypothetical protein
VDIVKIIQIYLKDVGRHAIKSLSLLIAVSEYIKLCACYNSTKACK